MIIDGKQLSQQILLNLKNKAAALSTKPTLAVIQVGEDAGSTSYINQKKQKGKESGIQVVHVHFQDTITEQQLISEITSLNNNPEVNGIIIQRPLPPHINTNTITQHVTREKDVDGFRLDSPFTPPVALAVLHILSVILSERREPKDLIPPSLQVPSQLFNKKIVILGHGETAGKPIARTFEKLNIPFSVITSRTVFRHSELNKRQTALDRPEYDRRVSAPHPTRAQLMKEADIVISCVGKGRVVTAEDIQQGVILVGVGISRVAAPSQGTILQGDYDENEIKDVAGYYTPTPGGVGPLTVAFLLANLLRTDS